jgi:hypothetical protein
MIELTLPEFDTDGKSTKDLVIMLLLRQHPLSAKQVWYKVNRLFGRNISYQGVYKTVSILLENGVLNKSEIGYEINTQWINRVRRFTQTFEKTYSDSEGELPVMG